MYMIAAVLALSFSIAVGTLLCLHTYLILTNNSTLEMAFLFHHNPFGKPNWRENVAQTMGYNWKTWLLPTDPVDRACDGMNYSLVPTFNP